MSPLLVLVKVALLFQVGSLLCLCVYVYVRSPFCSSLSKLDPVASLAHLLLCRLACRHTESLCSNACFLFFSSLPLLLYFYFLFFLCDVTFSADVLKANPSNFGVQITRVSFFLLVSIAVFFFLCVLPSDFGNGQPHLANTIR